MQSLIQTTTYGDILSLTGPEWILVLTALVVLAVSFTQAKTTSNTAGTRRLTWISLVGVFLAGGVLLFNQPLGSVKGDVFFVSEATRWVKLGIVCLAGLSLWLHLGTEKHLPHQGEFHALILFATVGMLLLVGADHLIMIFIALELTALSLYVLAGFEKSKSICTQTAFKYFLIGGVSAAFLLYGFSLIYGVTGHMQLTDIQVNLASKSTDPLLALGLIMALAGFGFKIAAAPFHMWAPDVYQTAPTPVASLIASASKVAGFFVLGRFLWEGFGQHAGSIQVTHWTSGWIGIIGLLACLSMVIGNFAALKQINLRRLLAYSAVAHSGYALLGIASPSTLGPASVSFYMMTYGISIVGMFGLLQILEQNGHASDFKSLESLRFRSGWMTACLTILILSMAGIPPMVGFLAKFNLFIAALKGSSQPLGLILLVVLALGASAVSLYYYLKILKAAFCKGDCDQPASMTINAYQFTLVSLTVAGVLLLGLFPEPILSRLTNAFGI
jgi:NADH-quinone oxidoreductase subunit N